MKNLFKAIALATVMCMILSTAAFASFGEATGDRDTDLVTVNVVNAGANEQVVLLIVDNDVESLAAVTDAQIQFIDQKQADANGAVNFGSVAVKTADKVVDVYVGSANTNGPQKLGEDIDLSAVKNITIAESLGEDAIITAYGNSGADGVTKGFAAAITVSIPEGLAVSKMIWGFKLANEDFRRYSTAQDVANEVAGDVQFAAAFDLGATVDNLEVEDVSAIFLTTDGREHFTNEEADAANKKN